MTARRRHITLIIHKDGDLEAASMRLPLWLFRTAVVIGGGVALLVCVAAILYAPIVRTAARVPGLSREVERLTAENRQVQELASSLTHIEARYRQLRGMLGADAIPELRDPQGILPTARALFARQPGAQCCYESGVSRPRYWPLDQPGVITRGLVGVGSSSEVHAGLDIAVAQGTVIRAAGGGVVSQASFDSEYGLFVQIVHSDGYESRYGHASRLLVSVGDTVSAGQAIGLSGSTGRSTAPHLHFEIIEDGKSIDPSPLVSQECSHGDLLVQGG